MASGAAHMRAIAIASIVALSGCPQLPRSARRPHDMEMYAIDTTIEAWRQSDLRPYSAHCADERDRIWVARETGQGFADACYTCGPDACTSNPDCSRKCASGCYTRASGDPLIVSWLGYGYTETHYWVIRHEAIHWLGDCTGTGRDSAHANKAMWGATDDGVQGRAMMMWLDAQDPDARDPSFSAFTSDWN